MVSMDRPVPQVNAGDILRAIRNGPACCAVCNSSLTLAKRSNTDESAWCESCNSFQKVYRGPPREELCISCFNGVGRGKKGYLCAALKYQMPDGTWRDRYNQTQTASFREGGMVKDVKTITPNDMSTPQFICECYEFIAPGETRESIERDDPLRFYNKTRFWD